MRNWAFTRGTVRCLFSCDYLLRLPRPNADGMSEIVQDQTKYFVVLNTRRKVNAIRVNISLRHMRTSAFAYQLKNRIERLTVIA